MGPRGIKTVFTEALERAPGPERAAYLDGACGDDAGLRSQVEALLADHERVGRFLASEATPGRPVSGRAGGSPPTRRGSVAADHAGGWPTTATGQAAPPCEVIGPYRLLQPIGEGGMGTVFVAQQAAPVRRLVALKVIKPGMDSRQVLARFEAERQALALMDHPNIAKVLDAGATEQGRPYFVMELVKGRPIIRYCDENRLSPRERLELFLPVCRAVQHAHQKGIIHRDIKPSNVLVGLYDGVPVPKVIDFGVAKATGPRLTEATVFTGFGALVGTPEYMSPEQARLDNLDIDTRSDIYALGVLLYELLTGTTPLERRGLGEAALLEVLRVIREEEPPRPSLRLSTTQELPGIAARRNVEPRKLAGLVRGELDWIVMKALEKDRNRRYETANGLAADIRRHLDGDPVSACPPSARYRLAKAARRHRAALATLALVATALVLGTAVSTWQAFRATRAERRLAASLQVADTQRRRAEEQSRRATRAVERERRGAYFQRIALADREWSANNLGRAVELLDQCPPDLRGWEWRYLKRLRGRVLSPLRHDAAVLCAAVSPDGDRIAASDQEGVIRLWDARTGRELRRVPAHEKHARSVTFSPDGRRLASGGWDGAVKVWDAQTGEPLSQQPEPGSRIACVAFSPDGKRLATAGGVGTTGPGGPGVLRVWDATLDELLFTIRGHAGVIRGVAFSPDGRRLATVSNDDKDLKLWDAQTGQELFTLRGHSRPLWCMAFSPDGGLIASGGAEFGHRVGGEVKVWDARTGRELSTLVGHVDGVLSVTFSPDGRRLVTGGADGVVKVWDVATGQEALALRGHRDVVRTVAFSPDGHRLVTASDDGTVRVWDGRPWREGEPGQESLTLGGHDSGVNAVAFGPRGRLLASAGADGIVRVWDARTGAGLHALRCDAGQVRGVAVSPDGRLLATGGEDAGVKLWDMETGRPIRTLPGLPSGVEGLAFSPDGRRLAAGGYDFVVRLWDVTTGEKSRDLRGHTWLISGVAFGPDGRLVASADAEGIVRVWDAASGQEVGRLAPRPTGRAVGVAFSPDGKLLACGGGDRTVRVWERAGDATTWALRHRLPNPTGGVEGIAFSPDGRRLAWGGTDATVKVWEFPTGEIQTLRGHLSIVHGVAFSPDGRCLASASQDGTVKVWDVPPPTGSPDTPADGTGR